MSSDLWAGLDKDPANFVPLSPVSFIDQAAAAYPQNVAVVHGELRLTYPELRDRIARLASGLKARGIGKGDVVSVMAPNTPVLLEAHTAVPALGAVVNPLNVRLDADTVAYTLGHCRSKLVLADTELMDVVREACERLDSPPEIVAVADPVSGIAAPEGMATYDDLLASGDPGFALAPPEDEWHPVAVNYTSGTTGDPKGVVYSHRGAFLNATANALLFGMNERTRYLWILPMFHCSGWSHVWAVTLVGGCHICLRDVEAKPIFDALAEEGVTHCCAAPVVMNSLVNADPDVQRKPATRVRIATGGAPPSSTVIREMENLGFSVTHLYGLTESYGPATINPPDPNDDAPVEERAVKMARQGAGHPLLNGLRIAPAEEGDADALPWDGETVGEIQLRSNTIMMGYLQDPEETAEAFRGGWFHTGDLAVQHPDGMVEIKDRLKDVIISGGENISSVEIEEVLTRHEAVMEAAVVAEPSDKWGETPCAFVSLKSGRDVTAEELIAHCKDNMARYKAPSRVVMGELPKSATGKVQKYELRERAAELAKG